MSEKILGATAASRLMQILKDYVDDEIAGIPTGGDGGDGLLKARLLYSTYGYAPTNITVPYPTSGSATIVKMTTFNGSSLYGSSFYSIGAFVFSISPYEGFLSEVMGDYQNMYVNEWSEQAGTITVHCETRSDQARLIEVFTTSEFERIYDDTCLLEGTKILTMSGEKNIEDLEPGEMIGFWNSESGRNKLEYAKMILPPQEVEAQEYSIYKFSDGAELKMHGIHMLWDADKEHLVRNIDTKIGDRFYNTYGEKVSLVSVEKVNLDEPLKSYNIFVRHRRYLANGIMCGHTNGALYEEYIKPENEQYRYKDPSGEYMAFLKKEYEKTQMYKNPQLFSVIAEATAEEKKAIQEAEAEDAQARKNLADTDYIVAKYAEGLISEEEFAEWKAKREAWRQIVRKNESEIPFLKNELSEKEKQIIKKI